MSGRHPRTIAARLLARTGTGPELSVATARQLEHSFDPEGRDGLPVSAEWSAP